MCKKSLLLNLELLEQRSKNLVQEVTFRSFFKTTSVKEKRLLLNRLQKKAEELLSSVKDINFEFLYQSFDNSFIIEHVDILQSKLLRIIRYSNLRIPFFISFPLIRYQFKSFVETLSKVINYTENHMN